MKKIFLMLLLLCSNAFGQNAGFESGNLSGWTTSGGDVGISTGLNNANFGGPTWTVKPYGTYMGQLYPNGNVSFDSATASLGLSSTDNTAVKSYLTQQANNGGGGDPTPTNSAWIKRTVTLEAGTTYKYAWNFLATDYQPFNDGSMITLVHSTNGSITPTINNLQKKYGLLGFTNPGTGEYATGSYGSTGWQQAVFTVPVTGDYVLGFATFNLGDTILSPMLFIDELQGTTEKNGQSFGPIAPNPGSSAPAAGGGPPTPLNSSTTNETSSSSSTSTTTNQTLVNDVTYSNGTIGSYGAIVYGSTSTTTTTTVTTPVTTTNWSDGTTSSSNGTSSTSVSVSTAYDVWKNGQTPSWSYSIPIVTGNSIYLNQSGINPSVTIEQVGSRNVVAGINNQNAYLTGNNSTLIVRQAGDDNLTLVKSIGNNNRLQVPQGYHHNWATGVETAITGSNNNTVTIDILGDSNNVFIPQEGLRNLATLSIAGSNNNPVIVQYGNDNKSYNFISGNNNVLGNWQQGNSNLSLISLTGNNNQASVNQTGNNNSSTISLTNSGGANNLTVTQSNSTNTTGNNFSLQQTCYLAAGCNVTVTQNK
jgi:hypothetical protein